MAYHEHSNTGLPGGTIEQAVADAIERMEEGKHWEGNDVAFEPLPEVLSEMNEDEEEI